MLNVGVVSASEDLTSPNDRNRYASLVETWASDGFPSERYDSRRSYDVVYLVSAGFDVPALERVIRRNATAIVAGITEEPINGSLAAQPLDAQRYDGLEPRLVWAGRFCRDLVRWSPSGLPRVLLGLSQADLILTTNETQAAMMRLINQDVGVAFDDVSHSLDGYLPAARATNTPVRLVWEGTRWGLHLLENIRLAVESVGRTHSIELVFISDRDRLDGGKLLGSSDNKSILEQRWAVPTRFVEWNIETYASSLGGCDIALAPMPGWNAYYRSKGTNKPALYSTLGLPVVASDIPAYREVVAPGETGFLCETLDDWVKALTTLVADPSLRLRMGEAGAERMRRDFSRVRIAKMYERAFLTASKRWTLGASPRAKSQVARTANFVRRKLGRG
jgi:glycosyltransferase involved in cell wall biosynthesis